MYKNHWYSNDTHLQGTHIALYPQLLQTEVQKVVMNSQYIVYMYNKFDPEASRL